MAKQNIILCQDCSSPIYAPNPRLLKKACFGCAACENFVPEPPIMPKYITTNFKKAANLFKSPSSSFLLIAFLILTLQNFPTVSALSPSKDPSALNSIVFNFIPKFIKLLLRIAITISTCLFMPCLYNFVTIKPYSLGDGPTLLPLGMEDGEKNRLAGILSEAIQCKTISYDISSASSEETEKLQSIAEVELVKLHVLLKKSFPKVYSNLDIQMINKHSIVYMWKTKQPTPSGKPILLCAHLDVVPAPSTKDWVVPPFSGTIQDGFIWGRGAIDNKHNVVSQLQAIELLLTEKFEPSRDIVLAFGHDEEVGGRNGAFHIARHLEETVKGGFEAIFDEGPMILLNALPGIKTHVALIANAEKGACTIELSVSGGGGHSSMPSIKEEGLVSILSKACIKLEAKPFPAHFGAGSGVYDQLMFLLPKFSGPLRFLVSNLWFFAPLLRKMLLTSSNASAAMLRTTTALTVIKGGEKFNVLPFDVKCYVNHRIHPLDSVDDVVAYDKMVINDPRVSIKLCEHVTQPSPISSIHNKAFGWLKSSVASVFDGNPSTCSLMIGNTDTKHYWNLSKSIYRFSPVQLEIKEVAMFHGLNEKLSIEGLGRCVEFYRELVLRANSD